MYQHILVAVEHSKADEAILEHIVLLARMTQARLLLVHVADGFAARHFDDLNCVSRRRFGTTAPTLRDAARSCAARDFRSIRGWPWATPQRKSSALPREERVDLIAMSTHGHRFLSDIIHGTTVDKVRHTVRVPRAAAPRPRMTQIRSSAPTRIDLAGGTLDIWPLYLFHENAQTLNAAISLRAHAEIVPRTDGRIVLESSTRPRA